MGKNEAKQRAAEEKAERIRTKDFFACIAPSTIKFYADHYIVGDSYRCAWAVREYPPSTDEQAIFAKLAEKNGVTLRIYHRLVEPMEQRKIIQNAARKNKLKSNGNDVSETVEAEILLAKLYEKFGITDETDYASLTSADYPIMEDFYRLCEEEYRSYDRKEK